MRHCIVLTIALVTFSLGLAAAASAQDHHCSIRGMRGAWGYTETGTVVAPGPTPILAAAVGRYEFESDGTFSGTQNSSAGGTVNQDLKLGTFTVNPDCTGTLTLRIFDSSGTTLRRRSTWAIVLVDNVSEFRGIMTSMEFPNGDALSPIMTMTGKRLFRDYGRDQ